ncbi:MAG: ATP-binding protein [Bacteroidales bacterium]|nr:ATP-binding protein [Bacteroidales bacterium]
MEEKRVRYPIGEHDFGELRRGGFLYVDKTQYIYKLINDSKFLFLGRPRRFGKSLLLSTLDYFFRGEKDLFKDTWLGKHEKEWKKYPVLHFDMSRTSGTKAETMNKFLHGRVEAFEKKFGVDIRNDINDIGDRFSTMIENIYEKTNQQVVILIDEYDNGILETLDLPKQEKEDMNNVLRAFYKQPKAMTRFVKFCMVTGVARFGSYTLFSGPNNYKDISMTQEYAACCGVTQEELLTYFEDGIEKFCKENDWSRENTIKILKEKYDSYRFTRSNVLVYNPFSLLRAFDETDLGDYWIKSGTSKVFAKYMSVSDFDLLQLQDLWVTQRRMEGMYSKEDSIPLLFQTGYLTIKSFKKDEEGEVEYQLGLPNGEVRNALVEQLMPIYMGVDNTEFDDRYRSLKIMFRKGDVPGWINQIKSMIGDIPYHLFGKKGKKSKDTQDTSIAAFERTYHIIVHTIFEMLNLNSRSEISVSGGRIDMVACTNRFVYVMEFKLDGTTDEALKQIDEKDYMMPWCADHRKVYKIGIVFSSKTHNISAFDYEPK